MLVLNLLRLKMSCGADLPASVIPYSGDRSDCQPGKSEQARSATNTKSVHTLLKLAMFLKFDRGDFTLQSKEGNGPSQDTS